MMREDVGEISLFMMMFMLILITLSSYPRLSLYNLDTDTATMTHIQEILIVL